MNASHLSIGLPKQSLIAAPQPKTCRQRMAAQRTVVTQKNLPQNEKNET